MKRTHRFVSVLVLAVLLAFTLITPVYAFDGRGGDKIFSRQAR